MITIAVDCMGGDVGPAATLPACSAFLASHPQAQLLLVGLPDTFKDWPQLLNNVRCRVVPASEVVTMDDPVEVALRKKKDSSMRVAIQQVKDGVAQAAVSAGNTGALMAIARYVLKTLDGIDRPAIASQLPNAKGGGTGYDDILNGDTGVDGSWKLTTIKPGSYEDFRRAWRPKEFPEGMLRAYECFAGETQSCPMGTPRVAEISALTFAAGRTQRHHEIPQLSRRIPDTNAHLLRQGHADFGQHPARIDHCPGPIGRRLVPDRWQTEHRPRVTGA